MKKKIIEIFEKNDIRVDTNSQTIMMNVWRLGI
jgi:hypothetical protein